MDFLMSELNFKGMLHTSVIESW